MHYAERTKHSQWYHVTCSAKEALIMVSYIITYNCIWNHYEIRVYITYGELWLTHGDAVPTWQLRPLHFLLSWRRLLVTLGLACAASFFRFFSSTFSLFFTSLSPFPLPDSHSLALLFLALFVCCFVRFNTLLRTQSHSIDSVMRFYVLHFSALAPLITFDTQNASVARWVPFAFHT